VIDRHKSHIKLVSSYGLELKPSKTHITHTLNAYKGLVGFDFLGFNVDNIGWEKPLGRISKSMVLGFKALIKPVKQRSSNTIRN
jgi:RNA-directed DNA polymerase